VIIGEYDMPSRMSKYHQVEERSSKNEQLYDQLQDQGGYSSIAGVVSIDTTNEVDVTRVKAMLQNRETYQKRKQYSRLTEDEEQEEENRTFDYEETRNHDIRDILDRAKEGRPEVENKYRKLKPVKLDVLKKLKKRVKTKEEEEEIQELIDTITIQTEIIEKTLSGKDGEDLFEDLKSHTMVGDPSSIKKIIEEVKEETAQLEKQELDNNTTEFDKSFYSSSMGFKKSDFESLVKDTKPKSAKKRIMTFIILLILIAGIVLGVLTIFA